MGIKFGKVGLAFASSVIFIVLFILGFEIIENIRYAQWRKGFTNYGWFNKITVPSANPVLMWKYRPYGEFGLIKTNRYGCRDVDFETKDKPAHIYRIAFIGDSITLGLAVSAEETFVRQFEIRANRLHPKRVIQALNFGVAGYNTVQIHEMLRTKVLDFSPNKVVYMMCLNDFDFIESSGKQILYFQKPKSFFAYKVERLYRKLSGIDYHLYFFRKNKLVVFQKIIDMSAMLKQKGVDFQVVILPVFYENTTDFNHYPLMGMHEEIRSFLQDHGISFIDMLDVFAVQKEPPQHYFLDVYHPSVAGHQFIAWQLASLLRLD